MSQADRSNAEFNRLFEQYSKKSDEELSEIIKPENGYTETAMRAASAVLQSDRSDYYQSIKRGEENKAEKEKVDGKEGAGMGVMPDKESAFLALCSDIHTIKNILIFFAVLTVLGLIGGFYTIFVTLQQLL